MDYHASIEITKDELTRTLELLKTDFKDLTLQQRLELGFKPNTVLKSHFGRFQNGFECGLRVIFLADHAALDYVLFDNTGSYVFGEMYHKLFGHSTCQFEGNSYTYDIVIGG